MMRKAVFKKICLVFLSCWYPVAVGILLLMIALTHFREKVQIGEEVELDTTEYTHVLPHNYRYPTELDGIRRLIHRQLWNTACVEIEKCKVEELSDEAKPIFHYLRGRVFRMLFENNEDKEYAGNGQLSNTCAASEFLSEAVRAYQAVVDGYPDHFLADDAFGWLGGCAYRSGNYVHALDLYLQLLSKYPRSDTALRYITNDIAFSISRVLGLWQEIDRREQERFLELMRLSSIFGDASTLPRRTNMRLPKGVWARLPRTDIQRLLNVLRTTGQLEGFLESTAGTFQIAHSIPLIEIPIPEPGTLPARDKEPPAAKVSSYLSDLISKLYYSGRFEDTKQVLDDCWSCLPDNQKDELLAYYWCSAVNSMSPKAALQFAAGKGFRNAVASIAYDFTTLAELRELCTDRGASFGDILNVILADRLAASGDSLGAIQQLFEMSVKYPDSLHIDETYLQILRLSYFLVLNEPEGEWAGGLALRGPASEEHLALFRSFETSFFGNEFAERNHELLEDFYRQNMSLSHFIWGWRQNFFSYRSIRSDFVTQAGRLLLRIRTNPDFDRIPPPSQRVILDLLEFTNSANSLIRRKYAYEDSLFRETLVPYMRARKIADVHGFEENILPILKYLWNILESTEFQATLISPV